MLLKFLVSKIHRATVTQAELDYVGSITIDPDLLDASGMKPFQYVNITNISNGVFWQTYILPGERGKGGICLNGPPARHFQRGDKIIILAEVLLEPEEVLGLKPIVVFVDDNNKVTEVKKHAEIKN